MSLDPRLLNIFVVLSEELSFSRAAARLNVAQPWVSECIRRLEWHAKVRLFNRTSRLVELSPEGTIFLPRARAILETLEAAESALRTIRASKGAQTSLSVVPDYYSFPERRILVEQFVRSNPETNLSIYWGTVDQIIPRLINGQTDLVFASTNVPFGDMLEATPVCARRAVAMVPEEHPLARRGAMDLEELSGAPVVVSPGYSHPDNVKVSLRSLLEAGAKLVPAPDSGAATIEHFARVHRFLCLRWLRTNPVERQVGDMVLVPISGAPLKTTNGLWRRRGSKSSPGALALWRSAALLHRVIEAGDRDPAYSKIKSDIERPLAELG